ncbi:hypothetical protein [Streptomyces sp. ISL-21]|uniref:hypothetical protein n=1 Tax=Streptomyces sp. ISL-21 TaxID=2819179 RepID=UPI001BEBDDF9|nr:hypothetical protein [Streptomyces sp. ISL-21]MBT2405365.1 hypothetical protein [Streptomyces sp. ISL-21]
MRRTTQTAVVLVSAGLLALTACGTKSAATASGAPSGAPSGTSATPAVDPSAQAAAALARHDRLFPDVATRCAGEGALASATPTPTPTPSATGDAPTDPEAAKYAENHAFKMQADLTPEAKCRGEAHARRISTALTAAGKTAPRTQAELSTALEGLGYPMGGDAVYSFNGGDLGFDLLIPETGPCLTGRLAAALRIEAHGVYMEGGCREPRGGH